MPRKVYGVCFWIVNIYLKQRLTSKVSRSPDTPSRNGHMTPADSAPPVPDRSYSVAKPFPQQASVMSSRPLPRRPDEAYERLLAHQVGPSFFLKESCMSMKHQRLFTGEILTIFSVLFFIFKFNFKIHHVS